jgi:hypothetical protein
MIASQAAVRRHGRAVPNHEPGLPSSYFFR